jgi:EmrB/QacA subfamily drug resistance transporter
VLLAVTVASGTFALMQAVVVPALPILARDLETSTGWATWTVSIYLLSASVATPLLGRLGDQFGKDRLLMVTLAIFLVGSVAAIFAWSIWSLIVFRAIQGVGGAVYPLSFSIIRDEIPPHRTGVAMGLVSAMLGVGGGIGIVMSGVIADHASWRLLFVVGAVVGAVALVLVRRFVPPSPSRAPARLDVPGSLLLSAGLICLLVGLTEGHDWGWGSTRLLVLMAGGVAIIAAWAVVERRSAHPMVDMQMLARRPVLFTNLAALFCGFTMYAVFTSLPLFAELPRGLPPDLARLVDYGFGASVTLSALYLLPGALAMLPAGPLGGVLGLRFGPRAALAAGLAVTAIGSALLAAWHDEPWQLILGFVVASAGVAVAFGAMPKLITDAVSRTETGVATGMNTVVRTLGSVIGSQVAVTLLATEVIAGTDVPAESGFTAALWLAAAAAAVAALLALAAAPGRPAAEVARTAAERAAYPSAS